MLSPFANFCHNARRVGCKRFGKVEFVVFPNSAGRIGNSPTPLSLHFPDEPKKSPTPPREGSRVPGEPPRRRRSVAF